MSIVEETRIALLELFPELAAAEAEVREALEAEAEENSAAAEKTDDEIESKEPVSDENDEAPAGDSGEADAAAEPEPEKTEEPEEEGPRENGVMLTSHAERGTDIDVLCDPDQVVKAAQIMDEAGFFLEAVTGVDWIKEEKLEVIYDYNQYGPDQCRVVVRAFISRTDPEIPTISGVMPSANWHERETHDFYGIKFKGHPYLVPLLLPEDADFHPLLKDFKP
jgi:NADH-quinone oxidoreductase subunit C